MLILIFHIYVNISFLALFFYKHYCCYNYPVVAAADDDDGGGDDKLRFCNKNRTNGRCRVILWFVTLLAFLLAWPKMCRVGR